MILEGPTDLVLEKTLRTRTQKLYRAKYDEGFPAASVVFVVRPFVDFARMDREDEFTGASTRWRFSP